MVLASARAEVIEAQVIGDDDDDVGPGWGRGGRGQTESEDAANDSEDQGKWGWIHAMIIVSVLRVGARVALPRSFPGRIGKFQL
jgi:hypothetical protein